MINNHFPEPTNMTKSGAKRQLEIAVNFEPKVINKILCQALAAAGAKKTDSMTIRWISPVAANEFKRYKGRDILDVLGMSAQKPALKAFWPTQGPTWSGLALGVRNPDSDPCIILLSNNGAPRDIRNDKCQARPKGLSLIQAPLIQTAQWLIPGSTSSVEQSNHLAQSWMNSKYYSFAVRLAHLYFFRHILEQETYLVELCWRDNSLNRNAIPDIAYSDEFDNAMKDLGLPPKTSLPVVFPVYSNNKPEKCPLEPALGMCTQGDPVSEGSLTKPPNSHIGLHSIESYTFSIGKMTLPVECNVFSMAQSELDRIRTHLLIGQKGAKGVANIMEDVLNKWGSYIPELKNIMDCSQFPLSIILENIGEWEIIRDEIQNLHIPELEALPLLRRWDRIGNIVLDAALTAASRFGSSELDENLQVLPIYQFLRSGFFLPQPTSMGQDILPPGCYILNDSFSQEGTLRHELAHAAMATHRKKGALVGCRWMEEGFAQYFQSQVPGQRPNGWGEYDVYEVWKYFESLPEAKIAKHLETYLSKNQVCAHCDLVKEMRSHVANLP